MVRKINYSKGGIEKLSDNKPVMYRIKTEGGKENYVGIAKRGRVQERIQEHLGDIPGVKVEVEQFGSIKDAREKEARVIKKTQPKYNEQDK